MNPNIVFLPEGDKALNAVEYSLWNITSELNGMMKDLEGINWEGARSKRAVGRIKYRIHSMQLEAAGLQSNLDDLRHNQEAHK